MKKLKLFFFSISLLLVLGACSTAPPLPVLTPKDMIQGTWLLESLVITENGMPVSDLTAYNGFLLKIEGNNYFVSNGNEAFPQPQGQWGFVNQEYKQIRLDDGVIINIQTLNADTFIFTFERRGGSVVSRGVASDNNIIPTRRFTFTLRK